MVTDKNPDKRFIGKITVTFSTYFTPETRTGCYLQCAVQAMLLLA